MQLFKLTSKTTDWIFRRSKKAASLGSGFGKRSFRAPFFMHKKFLTDVGGGGVELERKRKKTVKFPKNEGVTKRFME